MDSSSSLKGIELGKLVLSSDLLDSSWSKISEIQESSYPNKDSALGIKIYREAKRTFVVFAAPPLRRDGSIDSASTRLSGSKDQNPFHFLCSEKKSSFSIHSHAFQLFKSYNQNLLGLKSELLELLKSKKHVIITGAALGGSVACLFTLWLLETVEPGQKLPLCITFGSPFIGDASLQQILQNSLRNSCFLNVADIASQTPIAADLFKPFGTFLICFGSECICIDDTEAVMELLKSGAANTHVVAWRDYGEVLDRLDHSVLSTEADTRLVIDDGVIMRMEERAAKKKARCDKLKKLNDIKISMAYIEWYKKLSKEAKIGYYDRFKTHLATPVSQLDIKMEGRIREINDYWEALVEEVEKMPQSEKSNLKTRCLFSGHNYRRIIEPLVIARYYLDGGTGYRTLRRRSRHFVMLEDWFKAESIEPDRCDKRDLSHLLTFDSCFWADVEEAMIVIKSLEAHEGMRDEASMAKLVKFEEYVWGLIGKREVSPEIFLEKSSFMKWWEKYKEIIEDSSDFTEFMNTGKYERYGQVG
ncbi:unnamed protein product [Thlaspi arvense]|uniref:Senescence-associated carboxylesterase 101 n=1 Tax=Thlaspi arvense TaxID=13288 RepID=A0AAU9SYR1_THLAR|nr:unnamed protein product [Thlaspi arvense]